MSGRFAADHGGFEMINRLAFDLRAMGGEVVDCGAHEPKPVDDFPDSAVPLALVVSRGEAEIFYL